MVSGERQFWLG